MRHTYFLITQNWTATGVYYDESGKTFPLRGEVSIVRDEAAWSLGGYLEVLFDAPVRFTNDYQIFSTTNQATLSWTSYNPALGALRGTFEFIGDCIVSSYRSEDGIYSGTETLMLKEDGTYFNVGVSFRAGARMSAWTATLCKKA